MRVVCARRRACRPRLAADAFGAHARARRPPPPSADAFDSRYRAVRGRVRGSAASCRGRVPRQQHALSSGEDSDSSSPRSLRRGRAVRKALHRIRPTPAASSHRRVTPTSRPLHQLRRAIIMPLAAALRPRAQPPAPALLQRGGVSNRYADAAVPADTRSGGHPTTFDAPPRRRFSLAAHATRAHAARGLQPRAFPLSPPRMVGQLKAETGPACIGERAHVFHGELRFGNTAGCESRFEHRP